MGETDEIIKKLSEFIRNNPLASERWSTWDCEKAFNMVIPG